jgi:hypothetical protein
MVLQDEIELRSGELRLHWRLGTRHVRQFVIVLSCLFKLSVNYLISEP